MASELQVTDTAVEKVKALMAKSEAPAKGLRVSTKSAGCSGLKYQLDYVTEPDPGDAVVEVAGVKLFIDNASLPYIKGAVMDWKDDKFETGFVFDNPNATAECGCGESFMVEDQAEA